MTQTTTAVLGLGAMGSALARALLAAGTPVTVWNRSAGRDAELVAAGAARAGSVAEAAGAAEVVVVCLLDDASVAQTLGGLDLAGRIVVNVTTGSPADARAAAARVTAAGGRYVDGGLMAVPPMIGSAAALVLFSGDGDAYRSAEPALAAFGRTRFLGAEPGIAAAYDLAMLSGMYGLFAGAAHATALLAAEGVAAEPFTTEFLRPWLEAMLDGLPFDADDADSSAAMQVVGLQQMLRSSDEAGIDRALAGHLEASLHELQAAT